MTARECSDGSEIYRSPDPAGRRGSPAARSQLEVGRKVEILSGAQRHPGPVSAIEVIGLDRGVDHRPEIEAHGAHGPHRGQSRRTVIGLVVIIISRVIRCAGGKHYHPRNATPEHDSPLAELFVVELSQARADKGVDGGQAGIFADETGIHDINITARGRRLRLLLRLCLELGLLLGAGRLRLDGLWRRGLPLRLLLRLLLCRLRLGLSLVEILGGGRWHGDGFEGLRFFDPVHVAHVEELRRAVGSYDPDGLVRDGFDHKALYHHAVAHIDNVWDTCLLSPGHSGSEDEKEEEG